MMACINNEDVGIRPETQSILETGQDDRRLNRNHIEEPGGEGVDQNIERLLMTQIYGITVIKIK